MAQIKKQEVRAAILSAAFTLFRDRGYSATSMAEIARQAKVSPSNIYVYFPSKLQLFFAVYDPWLRGCLVDLEVALCGLPRPRDRLRCLFLGIWRDIPGYENGFANNLMQALSNASLEEGYDRELLLWSERKVSAMIRAALPEHRARLVEDGLLAHVIFMAYDGFAMNWKLRGPSHRIDKIIDLMVDLLLGEPG